VRGTHRVVDSSDVRIYDCVFFVPLEAVVVAIVEVFLPISLIEHNVKACLDS